MNQTVPDTAALARTASMIVRITDDLVNRFAAVTGDRSSLHVSDTFARRSAYRRPVVHGMLPVGLLAALDPFQMPGWRAVPVAISGRFASPVYPGDSVVVTAERRELKATGADVEFAFRIENAASGALVTEGTITIRFEESRIAPAPEDDGSGGMLVRPVELKSFALEQIESGLEDTLDFRIDRKTLREFIQLLEHAVDERDRPRLAGLDERVHLPNLLSILLFSTSVGVSLPGATATFLEFSAELDRPINYGIVYRLAARVRHRSLATRIVKKDLEAYPANRPGEIALRGKIATLVNKPSQPMPTMHELRDAAMDHGLTDKVVLVTGASRGIGETTAKLLALFGAKVVVNYHRGSEDAARIVSEIEAAGGQAIAVAADVASPEAVRHLVDRTVERYRAIDVLVNNAARDFRPIPFLNVTWDEVQRDIDVIVKGAFLCCQQAIPHMLRQGGGKIINISTVATDNPPPDQTKYVVAKSALVGLTRSLSIEFASRNIQVNLVVPNFVETDFVAHVQEGFRKKIAQETPMRRNASPVDVARAVLMLASSYSSFTTGQKIMVTGGGAPYA